MVKRQLLCLLLSIGACAASQPEKVTVAIQSGEVFEGPGDRPSVCLERARSSIDANLAPMTVLADALLDIEEIDEVRLVLSTDGTSSLHLWQLGVPIFPSAEMSEMFMSLFESMPANHFTPWSFKKKEHDGDS